KVGLDGGEPVLLTPEDADHAVFLSPNGSRFVDAYSTPSTPPVTVLRSSDDGRVLATVAEADASRLYAAGWIPPESFTVKARDGVTELHGMLFKPTGFDPSRKYPVVNYIYPGPQTGSVGSRSFSPARRDHQALAELGFIVVAIDGLGTPWRSKSFHDAFGGDIGDNTLPDQVAGLKQLADRYPWIDLDRVGVWGHSGGGYATADALFSYPDFSLGLHVLPRPLRRRNRRQHPPRPGRLAYAAGRSLPVDRPRPGRRVGPLRWLLCDRRSPLQLSRLLPGRRLPVRQPRQPRL